MVREGSFSLNPCFAECYLVQRARTGSRCSIASLLWLGSPFTAYTLFSRPKAGNQPRLPLTQNGGSGRIRTYDRLITDSCFQDKRFLSTHPRFRIWHGDGEDPFAIIYRCQAPYAVLSGM